MIELGPYRLGEELGSGGMGTVHLATVVGNEAPGMEDGERVALKLVHPQLLSTPGFFKRFLREAEVGKRIRHENVVRTLDVDATEHDGKTALFLVMEYVEGRTLRDLLVDLKMIPEGLLREIALQVAAGLAAIHAKSIVHRDLKPENVLITNDNQVRIMDLGVAKLQEASIAITREGQFAGSFLYAAPEQFNDQNVGPAADLYSLGVMLNELALGANAFRRDDAAAVINAHLNVVPPRVSEKNPELSLFFSEIVSTLLAKMPADRLASSQELHDLLEAGEASEWWTERERSLRRLEQTQVHIRVRRDTPLAGRLDELKTLNNAWDRAKTGEGGTILIEGEAGIGKTRLVDAFVRSVEGDGSAHILYGSYPPSGGIGGLSEALIDKFGSSALDESLAPYLTVTPTLVPSFAALLKHESPPTGSAPLQGDVQHTLFGHLLHALAAERPTVWIVEDLHFASEDSRKLVLTLARAAEHHPVLVVATSRDGLPEPELMNFSRLDHFRRLPVGRLSPRQVVELLREAFHSEGLADKLGAKIGYKSDGVPFFIFEMLRGLKEGGFLRERDDGSFEQAEQITDIEVPSAVKDLVEARLRELSEDQRAILDVGAVQGYSFDPDLVARVLEEKRVRVLRDLAEIERRYGIVRGEAGTSNFDQYQIQEVLYQNLPPDLRAEYHTLLADALTERESDVSGGENAFFLASNYLRGNRPKAAVPHLERALGHLTQAYRNDAALDLVTRALDVDSALEGAERTSFLLRKANLLGTLGRRDPQRKVLEEAQRLAAELEAPELKARVASGLCSYWWSISRYDRAEDAISEAMDFAREAGDRVAESDSARMLGNILYEVGRYEQAREQFERSLELAKQGGAEFAEMAATINSGNTLFPLGKYGEALEYAQRGRDLASALGMGRGVAVGTANVGIAWMGLGRNEDAKREEEDYLAIARQVGDRSLEGNALFHLAEVAEQKGEVEEAERGYRDALALRREIDYRKGVVETLVALGRLLIAQGRRLDAQPVLEEARELGHQINAPEGSVLAAAYLALMPDAKVEDARAEVDEHESRLSLPSRMEVHFALWKAAQDPADLAEARRILDYLVEHAPEDCRETMIANVPLHRDIAAAHEEHGA